LILSALIYQETRDIIFDNDSTVFLDFFHVLVMARFLRWILRADCPRMSLGRRIEMRENGRRRERLPAGSGSGGIK